MEETNLTTELLTRADTLGAKAEEAIQLLSAKLGVGSEHLWEILVRQAQLEGVASLVVGTTLLK